MSKNAYSTKSLSKNSSFVRLSDGGTVESFFNTVSKVGTVSDKANSLTIAFSFATGLRMVKVSIAHCTPEDKFKRAKGRELAIDKLLVKGEFVQFPLQAFIDQENKTVEHIAAHIAESLHNTFWPMTF